MLKIKRDWLGLAIFALITTLPLLCRAQIERGKIRLHLDTVFLHYANGTFTDINIRSKVDNVIVGPNAENDVEYSLFDIGFGQPSAGIGIGAAVIDNLVLGLRLNLGYQTQTQAQKDVTSDDSGDVSSAFTYQVLPYVEYLFLTDLVRPFVTLLVGIGGQTGTNSELQVVDVDFNQWAVFFGAGGGIHLFVSPAISIDLFLLASYGVGQGKLETADQTTEYTNGIFELNTLVGLSGWI